ncbi:MAG TPA: HAD-IC family P-type ATPase, partial [Chitinophagaceae bacterium]
LFFAYKVLDQKPVNGDHSIESDLEFLGIAAMIDPVREEVLDAIEQCKTAGIKTVMITGDQPLTAKAIAQRLHILKEGDDDVTTGNDLEQIEENAFSEKVRDISVYARVSPEQKMKIVKALQSKGEFVAMTGDGVNDAPSLKQADIGVSMGITGTDVTKQSADMILLDDNFTTIVKAVREGRRIYENIRKFILYVLSCNLGEILTIFIAQLLGYAIPLLPIHILWINLVTDGLPGIALVSEPAEKDIMNHPPRPPKENLFSGGLANRIILSGLVLTLAAITVLWWSNKQGYDLRTQQTMVFTTLCFVQLGNALSVRSFYQPVISNRLFRNAKMWGAILLTIALQTLLVYTPVFQQLFKTSPIEWKGIIFVLIATLAALLLFELIKYGNRRTYFK